MRPPVITPLACATIAILLAACGGGGGGSHPPASSRTPAGAPSAPGTQQVPPPAPPSGTDTSPPGPADTSTPSPADSTPKSPAPLADWMPFPIGAPVNAGNTDAPAPATPAALVSAEGIRGDVFLAMLGQKPCGSDWVQPVPAPDGSYRSEGMLMMNADASLSNYLDKEPDPAAGTPGQPLHSASTLGCNVKAFSPVQPGKLVYSLKDVVFLKFFRPPRGFHSMLLNIPTEVTAESVTMSLESELTLGMFFHKPGEPYPEAWHRYQTPSLRAGRDLTVMLDRHLPYGVVQQWTDTKAVAGEEPQFARLMLLPGPAENQARLCWQTHVRVLKRQQCVLWQIPPNWQFHQELVVVDQELIEDRATYPDESGLAYWRGKAQPSS
ncbi:MAG: hypothetical protein Q4B17_10570 [Lautropia sp.]|nr:hypothetical protein [Lautropia sp.]